jgi:protein-S-isoprenylcysteine O-methyltransferase Ste14
MNFKKLEAYATKIGIYSLLLMTAIGFLMVFDIAFELDILPGNSTKTAAAVFVGLLFVVSCSTVFISIMINMKRVVELIEENTKKED